MTRIITGLFFIICFHSIGYCDTITNWQVYHNNRLLANFNIMNVKNEIVFKKQNFKKGDSITVNYFRDTPCFDCLSFLTVEDGKHHIVTYWKGNGTFTPKTFSLDKLMESGKGYFEIYYHDGEIKSRTQRQLLFRLKIEY